MKTTILAAAVSLAFTAMASAQKAPAYKTIALDACPAPVKDAIVKAAAAGKLDKVMEATKDGVVHYIGDIDLADDRDVKVHLAADGATLKTVTEVFLKDAPEAIRASLNTIATGNGKVEDVEQVVSGNTTTWQAEIDRDGKPDWKIKLDAAGKEISRTEDKS